MHVYFAKHFRARKTGTRLVPVTCEECSSTYWYELRRAAVGTGTAHYYIGQKKAAAAAETNAQKLLAKRLEREVELVPCPRCEWVNQELVQTYRRRRGRGRGWGWIVIMVLAGVVAPTCIWASLSRSSQTTQTALLLFVAAGLVSIAGPVTVHLLRGRLFGRIDPNGLHGPRTPLPPGTPPALIEVTDPQSGESWLEPAAPQGTARSDERPRVLFHMGELQLARACCVCLDPPVTVLRKHWPSVGRVFVSVPLCDRCSRSLGRHWWLQVALRGFVILAAVMAAFLLIPGMDIAARLILGGLVGIVLAVFPGVALGERQWLPYRLGGVDRDRDLHWFEARNPRYTELVIEEMDRAGRALRS